ncbi:MAG: hypothetical protein ACREHG_08610 [Candidatus Saccharimonadales bacterium]
MMTQLRKKPHLYHHLHHHLPDLAQALTTKAMILHKSLSLPMMTMMS